MDKYSIGDVVSVQSRKGAIDCAVVSVRAIWKGRFSGKREYTLAPMNNLGKTYALRVISEALLKPSTSKYTQDQINKAIGKEQTTRGGVEERKEKKKERGREKLDGMLIGDEVLVNYSNASSRWEIVLAVNYQTGKVAIANPRSVNQSDLMYLARTIMAMRGQRVKGPSQYRWIHPDVVLRVRSPEGRCPCEITEKMQKEIAVKGWSQVSFGSEFIESSYVVAKDRKQARKGATYEAADNRVYFDPVLEVYWRSTGSFD
jgi:hypothetical protein